MSNIKDLKPTNPAVLIARNSVTGDERSRDDLFNVIDTASTSGPKIGDVNPNRGGRAAFPVKITGTNFNQVHDLEVLFGQTIMPIESATATIIEVGFPVSGFPETGSMDVTVRNLDPNSTKGLEDISTGAFYYVNSPGGPCFIATAAYGSPLERHLDVFRAYRDDVLLKTSVGTALVACYYAVSPGLADAIARHAALAATVRCVLTPLAWALAQPWLLMFCLAAGVGGTAWRRRMRVK